MDYTGIVRLIAAAVFPAVFLLAAISPQTLKAESLLDDTRRHYHDEITSVEGYRVLHFDSAATTMALEVRTLFPGRRKMTEWGVEWYSDGQRWELEISPETDSDNDNLAIPATLIELRHNHRRIHSGRLTKGIATDGGANTLVIEWGPEKTSILFGADRPEEVFETSSSIPDSTVRLHSRDRLRIEELITEEGVPPYNKALTGWDNERMRRHAETAIRPEGIWRYLDRENDPKYVRLGGRYTLTLVRDNNGELLLLYNSGAETNASQWKPGMMKARLRPTQFAGQYDIVWLDSSFTDRGDEGYATIDEESRLLTVYFPLLKATVRFVRVDR